MAKIEQLNEIIKHTLAEIIIGEIESPNFLITISRVGCSPDLSLAKVFISVLPENFSGTALKKLRSKSSLLNKILKNKANLVRSPRLQWFIDEDLKKFSEIEETLEKIKAEKY
ncbi:MAG: 30S ribosome-binding factor RbfA [Patescibacteria group bacterium]|jgi:ribosome-binding factor A